MKTKILFVLFSGIAVHNRTFRAGLLLILSSVLMCSCAAPPKEKPYGSLEEHYRDTWCAKYNGRIEVVFDDKTRADCVTATHAVELDRAYQWAGCPGQALGYASQEFKDGKPRRALCVLILKKPSDKKYVDRLESVIEKQDLPLEVQTMTREDL